MNGAPRKISASEGAVIEARAVEFLERRRFWSWSDADAVELAGWLDDL